MYLIKNALRNISRYKGKHLLVGCIAFVIGLSACLALSIREAAQTEKETGLKGIQITASIGVDRQSMMSAMQKEESPEEGDESDRREMIQNMQSLSLSQMQEYAKASSVKSFYYSANSSFNGTDVEAVTSLTQEDEDNKGFGGKEMQSQGDFTLIGYSSYDAMESFVEGTSSISEGNAFDEGSDALECIISEELATLNDVNVNDMITLNNPENEEESYAIKVVGIYSNLETAGSSFANMAMMEPANQIYVSYEALTSIVNSSESANDDSEDVSAIHMMSEGTYVFEDVEAYESFETEVREMGLEDTYTVTSNDVSAYERSLQPLTSLSRYAVYFLIVILAVGGCILIVMNIYRIRERKYEIGVLAAIGMNKMKIASQFLFEIFVTTMLAIVLGTGIGAAVSVPVTNTLLSTQSTSSESMEGFPDMGMGSRGNSESKMEMTGKEESSIQEVSSAANLTVVLELVGIGILLSILSAGVAVLTILRFEPLKILANRD